MDWKTYIHSDHKILLGKHVIKGTRLSVEFILGLFSEGWTEQQVLDNYPRLTQENIKAVFAYIYKCMQDGMFVGSFKKSA